MHLQRQLLLKSTPREYPVSTPKVMKSKRTKGGGVARKTPLPTIPEDAAYSPELILFRLKQKGTSRDVDVALGHVIETLPGKAELLAKSESSVTISLLTPLEDVTVALRQSAAAAAFDQNTDPSCISGSIFLVLSNGCHVYPVDKENWPHLRARLLCTEDLSVQFIFQVSKPEYSETLPEKRPGLLSKIRGFAARRHAKIQRDRRERLMSSADD